MLSFSTTSGPVTGLMEIPGSGGCCFSVVRFVIQCMLLKSSLTQYTLLLETQHDIN